jgi:hypothetical protein
VVHDRFVIGLVDILKHLSKVLDQPFQYLMLIRPFTDTLSPSNATGESQSLHCRVAITKTPQILAVEECSSGSSTPKSCHESMCYSVSEGAYNCERGAQSRNSSFHPSREDGGSCASQPRDSGQVGQSEMLNLVSIKASLLLPKRDLKNNNQSSGCAAPVCQLASNVKNHKNHANYQNDRLSSWNPLLECRREPQCENNQNQKADKPQPADLTDQNNRFFNETKYEKGVQAISIVLARQDKAAEKSGDRDETKESQRSCGESMRQAVASPDDYNSKRMNQRPGSPSSPRTRSIRDDVDVVVPSESAAVEPQEMAHVPEMHTESIALESRSPVATPGSANLARDSIVHKDTATILQELALQRLSGGDRVESAPTRRRYDSDLVRDRRSFDSEIGREIVREHKMKQELENARGKFDESLASSHNQR